MKRFVLVFLAMVSFAGPALAKDLSGYYSVQTEEWKQQVCKYGACENFYTGQRVVDVKPMFLADSQVRQLQAEGKLVESAPLKSAKSEKIRRVNKPAKEAKKSAPKKRAVVAKKRAKSKVIPAVPVPENSECATHEVAKGETVAGLAKRFGTTPEILLALNHEQIKNPNLIKIGWELKVPKISGDSKIAGVLETLKAQCDADSAPKALSSAANHSGVSQVLKSQTVPVFHAGPVLAI